MRWFTQFGLCIHTSPSGYKVYDNYFFRWLTLGSDVLQTVINKNKPYKPFLYYLPALTLMARTIPASTCLLGLGGAGLLHLLMPYSIPMTVVEKSKEVIDIAQHYFMLDKLPSFKLIHQAAEHYLEKQHSSYTHLLVDVYNDHSFPPECSNDLFFKRCQVLLGEHGFLAVNMAHTKEQYFLLQLIQTHFKNTLIIPVKHCANIVVIASNHSQKNLFFDQVKLNKEIKKIEWLEGWGYVGQMSQRS